MRVMKTSQSSLCEVKSVHNPRKVIHRTQSDRTRPYTAIYVVINKLKFLVTKYNDTPAVNVNVSSSGWIISNGSNTGWVGCIKGLKSIFVAAEYRLKKD